MGKKIIKHKYMANSYLEGKIRNYDLYIGLIVIVLVMSSFIAGRFFYFSNLLIIVVGLILGAIAGFVILLCEYFINKKLLYIKGLNLEERIAEKLSRLNIKHKSHIETDYGDLDLLAKKGDSNYGIEAKNWAGIVKFENGILKISDWDSTHILTTLLKHCVLVRNKIYGEDSGIFIKPALVFGSRADVHIPHNKIMFNGVEIIVATIRDFERYI